MKKFIEELRRFAKGGEEADETPEETLTRFSKLIQDGKLTSWVLVLGITAISVDRDGSTQSREGVTFVCPDGLTAPELRFIGARLVSRAEEIERRQDPRRLNL